MINLQNILIYGGVAVNVIGALLVMVFAVKYYIAYRQVKNMTQRVEDLKSQWYRQRTLGFGLLFLGMIIAVVGCFI